MFPVREYDSFWYDPLEEFDTASKNLLFIVRRFPTLSFASNETAYDPFGLPEEFHDAVYTAPLFVSGTASTVEFFAIVTNIVVTFTSVDSSLIDTLNENTVPAEPFVALATGDDMLGAFVSYVTAIV